MSKDIRLNYNRPMFTDQVEPHGRLTMDIRTHACWYYAMLAQKNRVLYGDGPSTQIITYDAENNERAVFLNKNYKAIAKSVAIIYGLESPDEFLRYRPLIEAEATRLGITLDDEIFRPLSIIIT